MANIKIALINHSTVVKDSAVSAFVGPLQKQVTQHFAPIWGTTADLSFIPAGRTAPVTSWQLVILDDADQADALGYHDLTQEGLPVMKIFAHTSEMDGVSWTSVASHETLESLADPWIDSTVFVQQKDGSGRLWPLEVCDAVEGDLYKIEGVEVSNFVTPHWFMADAPAHAKLDYLNLVIAPFEVRENGYMEYFEVAEGNTWQQINDDLHPGVSN
jgi:hypothetical protein